MDKLFDGELFRFGARRVSTSERKELQGRSPIAKDNSGTNGFFSVFDRLTNGTQRTNGQNPAESVSAKDEQSDWTEIQLTEVTSASPQVNRTSRVLQEGTITIHTIPHHHRLVEGRRLSGSMESVDHEAQSITQDTVHVDEYGFPLNSDEAAMRQKAQEAEIVRSKKQRIAWAQYIQGVEFDSKKIKKTESLRRMVRFGIPTELRGQLWQVFSVITAYRERFPVRYEDIYVTFQDEELTHAAQIEKDLVRTFPGHKILNSPELILFLRRILCSYAWVKPDVGYCQSMNFIAATLLLFMSEEEAFWMLGNLIEVILPPDFYSSSLFGVRVENKILIELIEQKLPRIHDHLSTLRVSIEPITLQWLMCLFLNTLPFETCMRIWDILFFDGSKILLRISLGILKSLEKRILSCQTSGEIIAILRDEPKKIFDVEHLFKVSWSKFWCGSLSGASIQRMRIENERQLEQEQLELSERRRIYHEMKLRKEKKGTVQEQTNNAGEVDGVQTKGSDSADESNGSDDDVYYEAEEYLIGNNGMIPKCFEDEDDQNEGKIRVLDRSLGDGNPYQRNTHRGLFEDDIEGRNQVCESRDFSKEHLKGDAQEAQKQIPQNSILEDYIGDDHQPVSSSHLYSDSVDDNVSSPNLSEEFGSIQQQGRGPKTKLDNETTPTSPTNRTWIGQAAPHFFNSSATTWKGSRADLIGIFQQSSTKPQNSASSGRVQHDDGIKSLNSASRTDEEQEHSSEDSEGASATNSPEMEFVRRTSFRVDVESKQGLPGSNEKWIEAHLHLQNDLHRQGFQQVLKTAIPAETRVVMKQTEKGGDSGVGLEHNSSDKQFAYKEERLEQSNP